MDFWKAFFMDFDFILKLILEATAPKIDAKIEWKKDTISEAILRISGQAGGTRVASQTDPRSDQEQKFQEGV